METIEEKEVRGISIKQLVYYSIVVLGFVAGLVYRDVNREKVIETIKIRVQAVEIKNEAQDKEREAIKTVDGTQDNRLTKVETILEYKKP